jgi:DNA methylase
VSEVIGDVTIVGTDVKGAVTISATHFARNFWLIGGSKCGFIRRSIEIRARKDSSERASEQDSHMPDLQRRLYLDIGTAAQAALIEGAQNTLPVRGLTHGFYKYPARFSPTFARAVIEAFTKPGDLVLDPYVGGGTTLVEALAAGRQAIGVDINPLAEFVTRVKSAVYSENELATLQSWAARLPHEINVHKPSVAISKYAELDYYRHLNHQSRWRLRKAIEQGVAYSTRLGTTRLESFGRCVVLRTAQWALDGRSRTPTIYEFKSYLAATVAEMIAGARKLRTAVVANGAPRPSVRILNRSAAGLEYDKLVEAWCPPRLVVTSPPYPGVHVLYHRWQVDGRKESPVPFMIADKLDGAGGSCYTMGDRKYPGLQTYFDNIRAAMSSVAAIADYCTAIVQMVAFSNPAWQLERYLETMEEAGLTEVFLPALEEIGDGRLWRRVPGRRWYSDQRGRTLLAFREVHVEPRF